jgi:hypothetical protein
MRNGVWTGELNRAADEHRGIERAERSTVEIWNTSKRATGVAAKQWRRNAVAGFQDNAGFALFYVGERCFVTGQAQEKDARLSCKLDSSEVGRPSHVEIRT